MYIVRDANRIHASFTRIYCSTLLFLILANQEAYVYIYMSECQVLIVSLFYNWSVAAVYSGMVVLCLMCTGFVM